MLLDMVPIIGNFLLDSLDLGAFAHMLQACLATVCHVEALLPDMGSCYVHSKSFEAIVLLLELGKCGLQG